LALVPRIGESRRFLVQRASGQVLLNVRYGPAPRTVLNGRLGIGIVWLSFLLGEEAVGKSFQIAPDEYQIVGVCPDAKYKSLRSEAPPTMYLWAYNVARRTGEIGIRMALGATRRNFAGPILREAVLRTGIGLAIGMPVALALSRAIKSRLYGVAPSDPITLIGRFYNQRVISSWS
jgi:hypothetical protein